MKQIYLAGGITGLTKDEAENWRKKAKEMIESSTNRQLICFSPTDHYSEFGESGYVNERAAFHYDLYRLKRSDLVLANMDNPKSLGTMAELAIAYDHGIPIIAYITRSSTDAHPWQQCMIDEYFGNLEDAVEHILANYYTDFT